MSTSRRGPGRGGVFTSQIPHVSHPTLLTSAKVAKRGVYLQDTMVVNIVYVIMVMPIIQLT